MRARGFSLVEAIVASVLLSAGLLALVASQRAMLRLDALARRGAESAEAAAGRLSVLRALGCTASAGSAGGAVAESWTVGTTAALRTASLIVSYAHDAGTRTARFDAAWRCGSPP